jgi:hypothetical protein
VDEINLDKGVKFSGLFQYFEDKRDAMSLCQAGTPLKDHRPTALAPYIDIEGVPPSKVS